MDTWDVSDEEFESVLGGSADAQFDYFVHKVADWRHVWVLAKPEHELAVVEGEDGTTGLAVWAHQRYAEACRVRGWSDYEPAAIELDDFVGSTLDEAESHGDLIAIMHSPESQLSVTVAPAQLREAFEAELEQY